MVLKENLIVLRQSFGYLRNSDQYVLRGKKEEFGLNLDNNILMYKLNAEQMSYSNYISVNMKFLRHFETQKYVPRCMAVCFHQN